MQCAAVISRSCPGLATTLAVQKWSPVASCSKSAPTRGAASSGLCALGVAPGEGVSGSDHSRNGCAPSKRARVQ
jgi:hypothetical protein